jgi:hypothetical protein
VFEGVDLSLEKGAGRGEASEESCGQNQNHNETKFHMTNGGSGGKSKVMALSKGLRRSKLNLHVQLVIVLQRVFLEERRDGFDAFQQHGRNLEKITFSTPIIEFVANP